MDLTFENNQISRDPKTLLNLNDLIPSSGGTDQECAGTLAAETTTVDNSRGAAGALTSEIDDDSDGPWEAA